MIDNEELETERIIKALGKPVDIRGGLWDIKISFENEYLMKASGELRPGANFLVYKKSMKKWETPHDNELVNDKIRKYIIDEVVRSWAPGKVNITFE